LGPVSGWKLGASPALGKGATIRRYKLGATKSGAANRGATQKSPGQPDPGSHSKRRVLLA
jgi:hypothetical protein